MDGPPPPPRPRPYDGEGTGKFHVIPGPDGFLLMLPPLRLPLDQPPEKLTLVIEGADGKRYEFERAPVPQGRGEGLPDGHPLDELFERPGPDRRPPGPGPGPRPGARQDGADGGALRPDGPRPPFPPRGDTDPAFEGEPGVRPVEGGEPRRPPGPPAGGPPPRVEVEFEFGREGPDPKRAELERQDRELERETLQIARRIRAGLATDEGEANREEWTARLREVVARHFQVRQQRRELDLERVGQRLNELRRTLEEREASRERIIQRRVEELLGTSEPEF